MTYMEFLVDSDSGTGAEGRSEPLGERVEVAALSDVELIERMTMLGGERCRAEARLAETAAEMHRRLGGRGAAALMRERLNVSSRQATADVELAARLGEFPATLAAWRAGEITVGHARVIARVGADPEHADEPALLEMARGYPVDMFARMTRQYMSTQDSSAEHSRQRQNRWASLVQDPDGSWRLSAYYDHSTGKRISMAFEQMVRTYRNGEGPHERVTYQQRRADALANLITGEGAFGRPKTTLLVIADYDAASRELRDLRYDDGLPVPADQIARIAAEAKILPTVFSAEGDPLWLGRTQRDATAGQRMVLAARDGGCVNCASPTERCEPHHIVWYSKDGTTDIDNLALLCERCHHLIHDDGWQLRNQDGRLILQPPSHPRPGRNSHSDSRPRPDARARPQRNPVLRT